MRENDGYEHNKQWRVRKLKIDNAKKGKETQPEKSEKSASDSDRKQTIESIADRSIGSCKLQ